MLSLYAYLAGGGSMVIMFFAKSQIFHTTKEYILFNHHGSGYIENGTPISIPIKSNNQPNRLIQSDEIHMIMQEPDTQVVHNRGHG